MEKPSATRGRPKLHAGALREQVQIRLSITQRRLLEKRARAAGVSLSAFLREAGLTAASPEPTP